MRTSFLHAAALAVLATVAAAPDAAAGDRPLIWEWKKNSDTAYAARFGSHLPIGAEAGVGAEIGLRGPDPVHAFEPVLFWAMLRTEGEELGARRTTRLDLRSRGIAGRRTLSVNNVFARDLGDIGAEFVQNYAFDQEPGGDRKVRIQTSRTVRLSSAHAGTVLVARAARDGDGEWRTSVGVEQPFRQAVRFSATVQEPGRENWNGVFRASYKRSW